MFKIKPNVGVDSIVVSTSRCGRDIPSSNLGPRIVFFLKNCLFLFRYFFFAFSLPSSFHPSKFSLESARVVKSYGGFKLTHERSASCESPSSTDVHCSIEPDAVEGPVQRF